MKGLYTTLLAAIALLVAMPVNAQTEYQLYGHLVGVKKTTASTSSRRKLLRHLQRFRKYPIRPTMAS